MFVVFRVREPYWVAEFLHDEKFGYSAKYRIDHECVFLTREAADAWVQNSIDWRTKTFGTPDVYEVWEVKPQ